MAGDVEARHLAVEVEQRLYHPTRFVDEPVEHQGPHCVAAFGLVEVVVGIARTVVHPIAAGDQEVAGNQSSPCVLNDWLRDRQRRSAPQPDVPALGAGLQFRCEPGVVK